MKIIRRFFNKIRDIFYEIKWAFQRAFRGYDDLSVIDIDVELSRYIANWISDYKKYISGFPEEMFEGFVPSEDNHSYTKEEEKIAEQRWKNILDKIELGFKNYTPQLSEKQKEDLHISFKLLEEWFGGLWE